MNSIHQGRVASLQKYGCFVEIDGFSRNGLVHISRLSSRRVESAEEVVDAGDRVFVKVVELKEQPGRSTQISLSMKDVSQGTSTAGGGEGEARSIIAFMCLLVSIQCVYTNK